MSEKEKTISRFQWVCRFRGTLHPIGDGFFIESEESMREDSGSDVNGCHVTITFPRDEFERINKIADTMNGVEWCDSDNTPETVVRDFLIAAFCADQWTDLIVDGIDTGVAEGKPEDKRRRKVLEEAFEAAGL